MAEIAELPTGFADKVLAAQSTFRFVMEAMARPGSVQRITTDVGAPRPVMRGTAAIALTLFDHDTPIWLDHRMAEAALVAGWIKFHTSAPVVADSSASHFALIGDGDALPDLDRFCFGSNEYPDRSTTLILQLESLSQGPALQLTGPGIRDSQMLRASRLPHDLPARLARNQKLFPRGVDLMLVAENSVAALPRTTAVVGMEA